MTVESGKSLRIGKFYRLKPDGDHLISSIIKVERLGVEVPIRSVDGIVINSDGTIVLTTGINDESKLSFVSEQVHGEELTEEELRKFKKQVTERLTERITQLDTVLGL